MSDKTIQSNSGSGDVELFLQLYSANQHRIYAFIMSLMANWSDADDISQSTMSVLWRKFDDFRPGSDFLAWAFQIAYYQVLAFRKKSGRERHCFTETTLEELNNLAAHSTGPDDERLTVLRQCVKKMNEADQVLLNLRYESGITIKEVSQRLQRSVHTLYKEYKRIHVALFHCMRRGMAQ